MSENGSCWSAMQKCLTTVLDWILKSKRWTFPWNQYLQRWLWWSRLCPGCLGLFSFLQHSNTKLQKAQRYLHRRFAAVRTIDSCSPHLASTPWWLWLTGRKTDSWVDLVSDQQVATESDPGLQRTLLSPNLKNVFETISFMSLHHLP